MLEHFRAVYENNRDVISELLGKGGNQIYVDFLDGEVRAGASFVPVRGSCGSY